MQKMAISGNTYYLFDSNGDGASFTNMGRLINRVKFQDIRLMLPSVQDVQILSILATGTETRSAVYFDGYFGVSNLQYTELTKKAKALPNVCFVPFRMIRDEEPGLIQVLYAIKPNVTDLQSVKDLLSVKEWRKL